MEQARVVIADDNEDSLEILDYFIGQVSDFRVVDKCRNGDELIDSVMRTSPHVVLLDIHMPRMTGMEAIRYCLKINKELLFICITSYDEYAVEAFELSALDYIVKPVEKTRLYAALDKVRKVRSHASAVEELKAAQTKRLHIKDNHNYYYIPQHEIIFIEKVDKKCNIVTADHTYVTKENISDLLHKLDPQHFFMAHRSYVLNLSKVSHIQSINNAYCAFFIETDKHAYVSKLKIQELQSRILKLT